MLYVSFKDSGRASDILSDASNENSCDDENGFHAICIQLHNSPVVNTTISAILIQFQKLYALDLLLGFFP